jgi:serine/threonine protein kinase
MAHRDISSGNVFIDPAAWVIYLIDFDSPYMPNLPMPAATTCGTAGYTAPFTWTAYGYEPTISWCALADRYSLAILCAEILTIDVSSPATNEGGLFAQEELRVGNGPGIQRIRAELRNRFPAADILLDRTLRSRRFADCPSPGDWLAFCNANGAFGKPPALDEIERVLPDYFAKILQNRRRPAPLWPTTVRPAPWPV